MRLKGEEIVPLSSRHLVDPELAPMLDLFPALVLNNETLGLIRAEMARAPEPPADALPQFPDIAVTEQQVPGPIGAPEVRVLIYRSQKIEISGVGLAS